jgi:hypothetical protein
VLYCVLQLGNVEGYAALQIPLVDGDFWWKYVARIANWPMNVGDPQAVKTIQDELMKLFRGKDKGGGLESQTRTGGTSHLNWIRKF